MRDLCAFLRQGFVVTLASCDWVAAEVEVVLPCKLKLNSHWVKPFKFRPPG